MGYNGLRKKKHTIFPAHPVKLRKVGCNVNGPVIFLVFGSLGHGSLDMVHLGMGMVIKKNTFGSKR